MPRLVSTFPALIPRVSVLTALLFVSPQVQAATWYVSATAGSDSNSGDSPGEAWETIDRAFGSACACTECGDLPANGDMVLVAPGTYTLCDEVTFIGGVTLRSEQGAAVTIVHAAEGNRHFLIDGAPAGTAIGGSGDAGFTLTGGDVEGTAPFDGGGSVKIRGGSTVTIRGCVFLENNATDGSGGALNYATGTGGQLNLLSCTFVANTPTYGGFQESQAQIGGGGAYLSGASPLVEDCRFEENAVIGADFDTLGGSASVGGGLYWQNMAGGKILDCAFIKNSAREGGGVQIHSPADYPDSVGGSFFYGNSASKNGGGANLFHGSWAVVDGRLKA